MSEDIAWAAGLFEGEGYFSLKQRSPRYQAHLEMGLAMTDKDVVERFAAITGMGVRSKRVRKDKPHWKDQWTCTISGVRAMALAQRFEPYLGARRLGRLNEFRAVIHDSRPKPCRCVCCGETFTPPRFRNMHRACSERCRDRSKYLRRKYGVESEAEAYELGLLRQDRPETRDHCPHGHPYAGDNLHVYRRPSGHVQRRCRECGRRHARESAARTKARSRIPGSNPLAALLRAER